MKTKWLVALLSLSPLVALAGPADGANKAQDRKEIATDKDERREEWRDVKRLEGIAAQLEAARAQHNQAALEAVDAELRKMISVERVEEFEKLAKDRAELRKDNREIRGENRDINNDLNRGKGGMAVVDQNEKNRDKAERHQDVRELEKEKIEVSRTHGIAAELRDLAGHFDGPSLDRKRALIAELTQIARSEARDDTKQLQEDRAKLRQDKRETRQDNAQGR